MSHHSPIDPARLLRQITRFADPSPLRSSVEVAITVVPFLALWLATWWAVSSGNWLGLLLALPAGGFLLRLFAIQHDCGHHALFRRRSTNDWVGRAMSVFTLTPYDYWRRSHAQHHATSGNLGKRGTGDVDTLTVAEYRQGSRKERLKYRIYRNPLSLFAIGPAYQFLLRHRLPVGFMHKGWRPWLSTLGTNAAIGILAALVIWQIGLAQFLMVHVPIVLVAATAGVWLFYVQHQFEHTSWLPADEWRFHDAAIHGSSHLELPAPLRWLTANIGIHHVHHLYSRIPFYRLPEVLRAHPELAGVNRLTLGQSFKTVRLGLWDETQRRLVPFREARAG